MRRFSQRNSLVTLSEINITPLLDLAFVLLIIFIITTPLLEQSVKLELPKGGEKSAGQTRKEDVATVEVTRDGEYVLRKRHYAIQELERELMAELKANPKLGILVRADKKEFWEKVLPIINICSKDGIQLGFATRNDK